MRAAETTRMFLEAASAPGAVRRMLDANAAHVKSLANEIRRIGPGMVVTCGRGSSDHAATYGKYLFETRLGLVTSSAAPSVASLHGARLGMSGALYVAISQSGSSPDVIQHAAMARDQGAMVVALVNQQDSPLARVAHHLVSLQAGPEECVASTKSFIVSLAALALLVGELGNDRLLLDALQATPESLAGAWECDWSVLLDELKSASSAFVVGRGVGYALALEAALKLKETARLHAEAFSTAEARHGPMALVRGGFPILAFVQNDGGQEGVKQFVTDARALGACVFVAGASQPHPYSLPCPQPAHELLAPLVQVQSFYRIANAISILRGCDPDAPPHLSKVTRTV